MNYDAVDEVPAHTVAKPTRRPLFDRYFAYMEARKPSDRFILYAIIIFIAAALLYTLSVFNDGQKTTVATKGGTLVEGIVGTPRFANPVLAITRADQDVVSLVYSGLMRLEADGGVVPDIAESLTISEDGLVYNIVLKDNVYFHDGEKLNTEDVAYTIALIQDPMLKSPLRGNWNDVVVEVINETELNLILTEPYAPFIENLTVGILPKHVWSDLSLEQLPFSQHNTEPVGSGPYKLEDVDLNKSGLIDAYTLSAFERDSGTPNISNIVLNFYQNEETLLEAFQASAFMSSAAFSYETLAQLDLDNHELIEQPLPRVFSVFLNQNKSAALRDASVREALESAIDREALIKVVLDGHGVPTTSPVPPGFLAVESSDASSTDADVTEETGVEYARTLLRDAGWEQQDDGTWLKDIDEVPTTLSIAITTANTDVFEKTAEYLRNAWETLGVQVSIALFEQSDLVQVIIRPRDYEALLFGTEIGRSLDLYPFWHSSQKDDPGLNVALYTNIATDDYLETARTTQDEEERSEAIRAFEKEVQKELPAIFLYSPTFTYVIHEDVSVTPIERIVRPSERFSTIEAWHMNENDVWSIFAE